MNSWILHASWQSRIFVSFCLLSCSARPDVFRRDPSDFCIVRVKHKSGWQDLLSPETLPMWLMWSSSCQSSKISANGQPSEFSELHFEFQSHAMFCNFLLNLSFWPHPSRFPHGRRNDMRCFCGVLCLVCAHVSVAQIHECFFVFRNREKQTERNSHQNSGNGFNLANSQNSGEICKAQQVATTF